MPWTPKDASKHNQAAVGHSAVVWSRVANQVLKKTGDDGRAIREANSVVARISGRSNKKGGGNGG